MSACQAAIAILLVRLPPNIAPREPGQEDRLSLKLIGATLRRLFTNKVLMFDTFAMVFMLFSTTNGSYMAKFIEFQFHVSPSKASLVSGSSKMLGNITALSISTLFVTYFQPSARSLSLYNFLSGIVGVIMNLSMMFIDCSRPVELLSPSDCSLACACSPALAPVCDLATMRSYTSACFAGCTSSSLITNSTTLVNSTIFSLCTCAEKSTTLVEGVCPFDCSTSLNYFMLATFTLAVIMTMGRVRVMTIMIQTSTNSPGRQPAHSHPVRGGRRQGAGHGRAGRTE
jgi:hypothetical protein